MAFVRSKTTTPVSLLMYDSEDHIMNPSSRESPVDQGINRIDLHETGVRGLAASHKRWYAELVGSLTDCLHKQKQSRFCFYMHNWDWKWGRAVPCSHAVLERGLVLR
jgi:hypothetical protein